MGLFGRSLWLWLQNVAFGFPSWDGTKCTDHRCAENPKKFTAFAAFSLTKLRESCKNSCINCAHCFALAPIKVQTWMCSWWGHINGSLLVIFAVVIRFASSCMLLMRETGEQRRHFASVLVIACPLCFPSGNRVLCRSSHCKYMHTLRIDLLGSCPLNGCWHCWDWVLNEKFPSFNKGHCLGKLIQKVRSQTFLWVSVVHGSKNNTSKEWSLPRIDHRFLLTSSFALRSFSF